MKFTYPSGSRPLDGYTIKRGVGRGGFGEVYYATSDAGKEVALKLIRRNMDVELRGVRQCLNLKHLNLISVHDIKTDSTDDYWIVMEFVSGESLESAIERNPSGLPVEDALRWMHGVLAGVAYLHDHGIVHRDLKPGNIINEEGVVKLGDYGLSKFISCSRRSGQTESVGTVHYMAPEIANGRYGREIDIYALGIIMYEMLTGCVPFEGESVGEVLMKHLTAEPDVTVLEEPFRTIVARALHKNPDDRFSSVPEMIASLPPAPQGAVLQPAPMAYTARYEPRAGEPGAAAGPEDHGPAMAEAAQMAEDEQTQEPIYQAMRRGWRNLHNEWRHANLHPAAKVALMIVGIFLLLGNFAWLAPLAVSALIGYAVYWVVRAIFVAPHTPRPAPVSAARTARAAPPVAAAEARVRPEPSHKKRVSRRRRRKSERRRRRWHGRTAARALAAKTARERATELTGSMLLSAAVVATMGIVTMILRGGGEIEQFSWMLFVGTCGAWAILAVGKGWEGRDGDSALRRFVLLVAGLGLGAYAFGIAELLMVRLPHDRDIVTGTVDLSHAFYNPLGAPTMLAYLAYFGFVFLIIRWWRLVDPLRPTRFSLWSTASCVFWAWAVSQFWEFPQPWGLMVAGVISVAVQLSSPWIPIGQRNMESSEALAA